MKTRRQAAKIRVSAPPPPTPHTLPNKQRWTHPTSAPDSHYVMANDPTRAFAILIPGKRLNKSCTYMQIRRIITLYVAHGRHRKT